MFLVTSPEQSQSTQVLERQDETGGQTEPLEARV